MNIRI